MSTATKSFDYATLDADQWRTAKQITKDIHECVKRAASDIISIGRKLILMRDMLSAKQFATWIEDEFAWDRSTAYRYISVAEKIGSQSHCATLAARTLYLLASPSTPEPIREAVLSEASAGAEISHREVKARIEAAKPKTTAECLREARELDEQDETLQKAKRAAAESKPRRPVTDVLDGGTMATLAPPPAESPEPVHRLARQARKSIEHLGELLKNVSPETAEAYREARAAVLLLIAEV